MTDYLIISWKHIDHMDGAYGKCLDHVIGTKEEAMEVAKLYVEHFSPVGIVEVVK